MNREEWVFEELKARKEWNTVLAGGGKSSSYNGLRKFEVWVGPKVKELQAGLASLEDKTRAFEEKNARLEAECTSKEAKIRALDKDVAVFTERKTALGADIQNMDTKFAKLKEMELGLMQRGITLETVQAVAETDVASPFDLLKRVKMAADNEVQEKKLSESLQNTQRIDAENFAAEKKLDATKRIVVSWEEKLANVQRKVKVNEDSNLIVQKAFARGYSPEALNGLFDSLQRFEVRGSPDASIKRLIRGLDGVKELEEIGNRVRQKTAQEEQVNADLSKVQGAMTAAVNTFIPTLNQAVAKGTAEITALKNAAARDINELSAHQKGEISKMEENAEGNLAAMNNFTLREVQKTLNILNKTALNLTDAFRQCSVEINKWGEVKTEAGKYEADLKWGNYIQSLRSDPKLAKEMPTPLALQLADWLHIWVERRLPEATTLPPQHVSQRESALNRYYQVKIINIIEWVRCELRELQRRGVV